MPVRTRLIAVCGVDGAGKSSLVDEMERRRMLPDCAYMRRPKTEETNGALVARHAPRRHGDGRDWISGEFAEAMGVALAFDYLEFYDRSVRPLIGVRSFIVCDRYALCFIAYLKSIGSAFPIAAAYDKLWRPDLTVYVSVPLDVLHERHARRGGRADDEHPEVSVNFDKAYRELLPLYAPEHVVLDNGGTLEEGVSSIGAAVRRHFPDESAFA